MRPWEKQRDFSNVVSVFFVSWVQDMLCDPSDVNTITKDLLATKKIVKSCAVCQPVTVTVSQCPI